MRSSSFLLIVALALTVWAYRPLAGANFVYDDQRSVFVAPVTSTQFVAAVKGIASVHPRTLTVFSFWLTRYFSELTPRAYHVTNVILHLLVGALLYWASRAVLSPMGASLAVAIFLVHPVNSQAVSYLSARSELVAALGLLLAIGAGLRGSIVGLLIGAALGVTGKETAVVAVPLCAWLLWRTQTGTPRLWRTLGVLFVVGAGVVAWPVLHYGELFNPNMAYSPLGMMVRNVAASARLLALFVWPVGFSVEHDVTVWTTTQIACGVSGWLLLGLTAWRLRQRSPWLLTCAGWVLLALLPRLLLPYEEWITEHQLYVPMLGLCWGVGGMYDAA